MSKEVGVRVEDEPEWTGPDPLREMVRKGARRMVPASEIATERARVLARVRERVEGLVIREPWEGDEATEAVHDHIDGDCGFRAAVLAILEEES